MRLLIEEGAPLLSRFTACVFALFLHVGLASANLAERAEQVRTPAEWERLRADPAFKNDPLTKGESAAMNWDEERDQIVTMLRERERLGIRDDGGSALPTPSGASSAPTLDAKQQAEEILQSPLYRVRDTTQRESWVGQSTETFFERVREWWQSLFRQPEREPQSVNMPLPIGLDGLVWIIIGVTVVAFLIWAALKISLPKRGAKETSAGGILDESEPDRTADEWLSRADELAARGEYRAAVRALYLALLMRADDNGIARFLRYETNWEHLARIESSPKAHRDLDFRGVTQRFDQVWYGSITEGRSDYDWFRDQYARISHLLKSREAAS